MSKMTKTQESDDFETGMAYRGSETVLIERRELLKMLGVAAGAAGIGGCDSRWVVPERLVELALRGPGLESEVQTICGLCEGACGISVRLVDGLPVGLKGNPHHPLNRGGLCPVGLAGLEVLYAPDRLRGPLRRSLAGGLEEVSWESVLGEIGGRLGALYDSGQGAKVAVVSGEISQLFHDLARQFVASIGSGSIAQLGTQSTLPFKLMHGIDEIPGYDLERADMVMAFGLEAYEDGPTPMHAIAATIGSRPAGERATLIYVGSRMSPTAAKADIRALVRPETLGAFALGIAHVLVREGRYDRQFVDDHTFGFDEWEDESGRSRQGFRRLLLEHYYPDRAAQLCGCEPELVVRAARRFAAAERPVAITGGTASHTSNATFTTMAVHALNALVGNFDRPGGVTLPPQVPLTPMPELEGDAGREADSIFSAASAAGPLDLDPVESFAEAVLSGEFSPEVLLIIGSNPVHSSPAGRRFQKAMEKVPTVVALATFLDDTAASADFVLPTSTFLESWNASTTPAGIDFSTIGIGKPVVTPIHDTRHAADVLLDLGRRTSSAVSASLPWADYPAYLKYRLEGLAASGQGAVATGSYEDSWVRFLEERGWRFLAHEGIEGLWESFERNSAWWNPVHLRGDWSRYFQTSSGRFEFFSRALEAHLRQISAAGSEDLTTAEARIEVALSKLGIASTPDEACLPHFEPPPRLQEGELRLQPFRPVTARGDLGATSPMVLEMFGYSVISGWRTYAELAPETASDLGLHGGDEVSVESVAGSVQAVVRVMPGTAPGTVHLPLGLGHPPVFGMADRVGENAMRIISSFRDPLSGRLSMTSTGVRLKLIRRGRGGGPVAAHGGTSS